VVGIELLSILEERRFPIRSLRLLASFRSAGKTIEFMGTNISVEDLDHADPAGIDIAFFSAGKESSVKLAPSFAKAGAWVIDNSSAFRDNDDNALIVPEINGHLLNSVQNRIIANPNCSTIIASLPLFSMHKAFGINKILVSTYQAVSGAGAAGLNELDRQTSAVAAGEKPEISHFPRQIVNNVIPWIGEIDNTGFCVEELKMPMEAKKILGTPDLKISATSVRVPVRRCHSMAVWIRLEKETDLESIENAFSVAPGVELSKGPPCPADLEGVDDVYVGRIRRDPDDNKAWWIFAVSDQLRKGAALNAVQIGEELHRSGRLVK